MIVENARTAMMLETALTSADSEPAAPPWVRQHRARLVARVFVMLGIPPTHVVVTDDPVRDYGARRADLVTARDPDDETRRYRFLARPGSTDTLLCSTSARRAAPTGRCRSPRSNAWPI